MVDLRVRGQSRLVREPLQPLAGLADAVVESPAAAGPPAARQSGLHRFGLDRLTRQQSGIYTIDETIRGSGRIEFATEEFEDTAIGRFTWSAKAFVAEAELEKIAIRSAMGRQGRVSNGRLLVSANSRFCYRYAGEQKGQYEIDPMQAPLLKRIFADFVAGKSISRIVSELNEEGIPTNTGTGRWHKPTVWNLLRCRSCLGEAVMMRTTYGDDGKSRALRPESEMVMLPSGTIPPLIDRFAFDRVQARLERNKAELVRPNDSTDSLLRGGFIWCGACGRRMTVKRSMSGNRLQVRYICQYRDTCRLHVISAPLLDEGVWSRVSVILAEPERLRAVLSEPIRDLAGEIAAVDRRIEELCREESGLTRLGAKWEEGDDELESVLTELRETKARRRVDELTRERLVEEMQDEATRRDRIEATISAIEQAGATEALDYAGRGQALSDLGVRVAVYPSWHESPYRWVMSAVEIREGERQPWVDGEALNRVSAAASPSRPPVEIRTGRRGRGRLWCGAPSARVGRQGGRAWSAPATGRDRDRGALVRRRRLTGRRSG